MNDVRVKLKDGRVLQGPIGTWRPKEGYFDLCGIEETIFLVNVESARSTTPVRTHLPREDCQKCEGVCTGTQIVDYRIRAREQGWAG